MGEMVIKLFQLPFNCDETQSKQIAAQVVDCLWEKRISVSNVVFIDFDKQVFMKDNDFNYCLDVEIQVIASTPPRKSTKIKVLNLLLL